MGNTHISEEKKIICLDDCISTLSCSKNHSARVIQYYIDTYKYIILLISLLGSAGELFVVHEIFNCRIQLLVIFMPILVFINAFSILMTCVTSDKDFLCLCRIINNLTKIIDIITTTHDKDNNIQYKDELVKLTEAFSMVGIHMHNKDYEYAEKIIVILLNELKKVVYKKCHLCECYVEKLYIVLPCKHNTLCYSCAQGHTKYNKKIRKTLNYCNVCSKLIGTSKPTNQIH
ncbi:MAG: hypothetical protein Edafosvirus4_33 [Edafosvirus sp.]|uniref:RING-type domain-containing protein n=1 Tax=Edafosvirus sp. TaxID=2487765 RepID=A0A3G4ZX93_9VIRU|nr:MAG: hypothetical protein Edafosvirus4_33 [Edafosvirus sp.]